MTNFCCKDGLLFAQQFQQNIIIKNLNFYVSKCYISLDH